MNIEKCIDNAVRGISKLNADILAIEGMSSERNRHLLNNIGSEVGSINYLEVGVHKGSTFISSLFGNRISSAIAIDDWSQFQNQGVFFTDNCHKFGVPCLLIEDNCFNVSPQRFHNINFYLYDGNHSMEQTAMGITHFYDSYADEIIYVVDDFDWDEVRKGTERGIVECGLKIKKHIWLKSGGINSPDSWWNGVGIYILRK